MRVPDDEREGEVREVGDGNIKAIPLQPFVRRCCYPGATSWPYGPDRRTDTSSDGSEVRLGRELRDSPQFVDGTASVARLRSRGPRPRTGLSSGRIADQPDRQGPLCKCRAVVRPRVRRAAQVQCSSRAARSREVPCLRRQAASDRRRARSTPTVPVEAPSRTQSAREALRHVTSILVMFALQSPKESS